MANRSRPLRICTGCGIRKEKTEMVRIVSDPSGSVIPDLKGSLPSRGAYVCPDAGCIAKASTGRLGASLKVPGDLSIREGELQTAVAESYKRRVCALLGQAKKSGRFVSGTNLVEGELRRGSQAHWFAVLAMDTSDDIAGRLTKRLDSSSVPYRFFLGKEELGGIMGKSPRSAVLIKDEGISNAIAESLDRYIRVLDKGGFDK